MGFYRGPNGIRNGLVVQLDPINPKSYPGTGSIVYDISIEGLQRNATLVNNATIDSDGISIDENLNQYFTISQPSITLSPNRFTIELWIKPTQTSGWVCMPSSPIVGYDQYINFNSNESISFVTVRFADQASNQINGNVIQSVSGSVPFNKWSCITATLDYLDKSLYVNGELAVNGIYPGTVTLIAGDTEPANWGGTWWFGRRVTINGTNWGGVYGNIKIYNRALTPNEVQQNFYAHKGRYNNLIDND